MDSPTKSQTHQRRALDLFNQSLEQPQSLRYAWLADQCKANPELLSLVLKLMAADQVTDSFLDQPVAAAPRANPGDRAGPFELLEEIGAGGAGRVFRARRADGQFDQQVAVKLFETYRLSGPLLERFHAERQILASLEHPGIARLIDGGSTENGLPFVAMELVRGDTITAYCASQKLDIASRLALFQKVCEALEAAHDRGIVHRDIKPGNILVGEDGEPKIIDFGIAKVLDPLALGLPESKTLTRFQALTPEYASPEQVRGEAITPAADVYSMGVLLYEMLTGVRPYQISTLSPSEIERTVCQTIPDDPSARVAKRRSAPPLGLAEAGDLNKTLRGDIDRIVMTALSKEPELRYRSAAQFSRDIERYLSGHPVAARGASRVYRSVKFFQRNRAVSTALAVVILALSGTLLSVTQSARETRLEAGRTEAVRTFLIQMVSTADPFNAGVEKTIAAAVRDAIPSVDEQFADQPEIQAELRYAIGLALYGQGKYELARQQMEQALGYFQSFDLTTKQALARAVLGRISWTNLAHEEARVQLEAALELAARDRSDQGRTLYLELLGDLSGLLPNLELYDEGLNLAQEALALISQGDEISALNHAVIYNNLAICYDSKQQYPEAIEAYKKSIALHRSTGQASADLAIALGNLGQTYELVDDMKSALARAEEGYLMIGPILGQAHPETLLLRHNLGSLLLNAEQHADAAGHLSAVALSALDGYGPEHLYTGRFFYKAALASHRTDQRQAARQQAAKARAIFTLNDQVPDSWLLELDKLEQQIGPVAATHIGPEH